MWIQTGTGFQGVSGVENLPSRRILGKPGLRGDSRGVCTHDKIAPSLPFNCSSSLQILRGNCKLSSSSWAELARDRAGWEMGTGFQEGQQQSSGTACLREQVPTGVYGPGVCGGRGQDMALAYPAKGRMEGASEPPGRRLPEPRLRWALAAGWAGGCDCRSPLTCLDQERARGTGPFPAVCLCSGPRRAGGDASAPRMTSLQVSRECQAPGAPVLVLRQVPELRDHVREENRCP